MNMDLQAAIELLKSAGYTVRRQRQTLKKSLSRVGPTFVAQWDNGETTRMTVHCDDMALDLLRAVKVSRAAFDSRTRYLFADENRLIMNAWFERDGKPLDYYSEVVSFPYTAHNA